MCITGTLKTFEAALERCSAQLKRIKERKDKVCSLMLSLYCSSSLLGSRERGSTEGREEPTEKGEEKDD